MPSWGDAVDLSPKLERLLRTYLEHNASFSPYFVLNVRPLQLINDPKLGDSVNKKLFIKLRSQLPPSEWSMLPKLILEAKRRVEEEQRRAQRVWLNQLNDVFTHDFLGSYNIYKKNISSYVSLKDYGSAKRNYVQEWVKQNLPNTNVPDEEQAAAVAAVKGHVQVAARAGSGKTMTLIQKTVFLQKHCGVSPDQMLLLAFNKKAADKMGKELKQYLDVETPTAMTFHALAHTLVQPQEVLVDEAQGERKRSRAIQTIIDESLENPGSYTEVRDLMMKYYREDWEAIISGGLGLEGKALVDYRRSLPRRGVDGTYLRSRGEKVIADFLFEHGIGYQYERPFWLNGIRNRPDFTIGRDSGVVIEYFGWRNDPVYEKNAVTKRAAWQQNAAWKLLELSHEDFSSADALKDKLRSSLESHGIPCFRLSDEEIWTRVNVDKRAIGKFTEVIANFIGRCCKLSLSPAQLEEKISGHGCLSEVEKMFLPLASRFYGAYLEQLRSKGQDDFDILIQRATKKVMSGQTSYRQASGFGNLKELRYIFIDEYQDFSGLFHNLVEAIRQQNPNVYFFCVGDDWQAINGFAGSDLNFYENFKTLFRPSRKLHVSTNYRSASSIVDVGNALMQDHGRLARAHKKIAGEVLVADLSNFSPTDSEKDLYGDELTPMILRIISSTFNKTDAADRVGDNAGVVLLNRTNNVREFINYDAKTGDSEAKGLDKLVAHLRSKLPREMHRWVSASTAHKYKGAQKNIVVVLDAVSRSYPLIHPDGALTRILGDDIKKTIAEDQRLFYVALTRAVETLIIVTRSDPEPMADGYKNMSPFLEELQKNTNISELKWSSYPPLEDLSKRVVVKVGNSDRRKKTKDISVLLGKRGDGYTWRAKQEVWYKSFPADGFSPQTHLELSAWVPKADGVTVKFYNDREALLAAYTIDDGEFLEQQS